MKPIELAGDLVAIKPLQVEHAAGLLDAADAEEAFAWLPYSRPTDLEQARTLIEDALVDQGADRRSILRSEWPDAKEGLRNRIAAAKAG